MAIRRNHNGRVEFFAYFQQIIRGITEAVCPYSLSVYFDFHAVRNAEFNGFFEFFKHASVGFEVVVENQVGVCQNGKISAFYSFRNVVEISDRAV